MPVERIFIQDDALWGFWKIEEDEASLSLAVPLEQIAATLTNPLKRLEFLAGRALIKHLAEQWNITYQGLNKDIYGKPYLRGSALHISLSHSYPYVAAILHRHKNVGIDLEQPKEKLLRIAPRVLSTEELRDAGDDIVKHCIYWCGKETLIKIHGKKDLTLATNLHIAPFTRQENGNLIGRILVNDIQSAIPLSYLVSRDFVVVVSG